MVVKKSAKMEAEGKNFDIMDMKQWEHTRFADIAHECIAKLQDKKMKAVFLKTFDDAFEKKLTYYEFYHLFNVTMGITSIPEWMYEDFETSIDNFGLAFMELNDMAQWLKDHGYDLGVKIKEEDSEDIFNR